MYREMNKWMLDDESADRLLSGTLHPDDAPPGFAQLTALLRAAGRPASPSPIDQQRIAAIVAAISAHDSQPADKAKTKAPRPSLLRRARVSALLVAGMLFGSAGLAMAGALPSAMQSVAATVLSKVGISVPSGHRANTVTGSQGTTPAPGPTRGPDPNGPAKFGLCNAFSQGQGGVNGNKNNSVAFTNLQQAAQAAGQSVQEFCKSATPGGKDSPAGHQSHGHGSKGKHNGQNALPPNGRARGHGRGNRR
jgi:hypothetical protein